MIKERQNEFLPFFIVCNSFVTRDLLKLKWTIYAGECKYTQ